MAISYVGAATGTTSATPPAHVAGDVLLAFAHRDGNTTAPSLPAGWTDLGSSGANVNSSRLGFKVATSSGETSGTWTNATGLVVLVYRGCAAGDPIGDVVGAGSSSLVISYPALTMQVSDGSSWAVGVAGHRSADAVGFDSPPSGMSNRAYQQDAAATLIGNDTAGGVSSWSAQTVTATGTSGGWRSWSVELLAAATGGTDATATGTTITATASLTAGAASGVRNATATGTTLTATASLTAGTASGAGGATALGALITATASLVAGAASGVRNATASGALLAAVASLLPGSANNGELPAFTSIFGLVTRRRRR